MNARLPKGRRIKVWLGEPPVDWNQVRSRADLVPLMGSRDSHPAKLIVEKILARERRALVIYGGAHFFSQPPMPESITSLVEREHPGAFYLVTVYRGFATAACDGAFEAKAQSWSVATLVAPIEGTWIERSLRDPDCAARRPTLVLPPGGKAPPLDPQREARRIEVFSGVRADGLIYLGRAAELHEAPSVRADYLDDVYLAEMARRQALLGPAPPSPATP
jgi:hypothetical protein